MGIGIMIPGAHFTDERYIVGKVKIPEKPVPECEHVYDNDCDATCNLCGAVRTVPHNLIHVDAVAPTDTENGNVEYWYCSLCGGYWLDEACAQPTTAEDVVRYSIGSYPVQDTLKGLYDLGGTQKASLVNHAPAGVTPTFYGTYDADGSAVKFTGRTNSNFLDTGLKIVPENTVTIVALFSVPTGFRTIIGCRFNNSPVAGGMSLLNKNIIYCVDGTAKLEAFDAINSNNFAILALQASTQDSVGVCKVWRYTNGSLSDPLVDYSGAITDWSDAITNWRIGGDKMSSSHDDAYISLAAIHEGVLTDEQLESVCEFVKVYGEQKGLTIE